MDAGWSQTQPVGMEFAIVRHPVDRWWSGVHQYHLNNSVPHKHLFDQARGGKFHFDQHTQPQVSQIPDSAYLVPFERMGAFAELLGLNLREMRVRDQSVEAPDLIPSILEFYVEDLALYDRARRDYPATHEAFSRD